MGKRPYTRKDEMRRVKRRLGISHLGTHDRDISNLLEHGTLYHVLDMKKRFTAMPRPKSRKDKGSGRR